MRREMWEVRDSSLTELLESIRDVTRQILRSATSPLPLVTWERRPQVRPIPLQVQDRNFSEEPARDDMTMKHLQVG
jgi:hypothetical protein